MRKVLLLLIGWIGTILPLSATTFTVTLDDGGWGDATIAGTLAKAIADFNSAPAGSHTIDITVNTNLNDPAKWAINKPGSTLTINGNNTTTIGPGYSSWTLNINKLIVNNWTFTGGFANTPVSLGGAGGHSFTNSTIYNVSFTFTKDGNSFVNSTFTISTGTYGMSFNGSNSNNISGCTFDQMPVSLSNSTTNTISNTRFAKSGLSLASGSNNNTIYGCKFNTNAAGSALVSSGIAYDITISGSTGNIIGANNTTQRNIFALSSTNSIALSSSANTSIVGNYFGTDITGLTSLSGTGTNSTISITASQNVIVDSNIVSSMQGTAGGAIEVVSGNCTGLKIRYNLIGVNKSGAGAAAFQNKNNGILLSAGTVNSLDIIGNTISRSVNCGIRINANINPLKINNNFIGSNSTGLYDGTDYGNGHGGIVFESGTISNVTIDNNVIVRNGWGTQDNFSCGLYVLSGVSTISITNNHVGVYSNNAISGTSGNAFPGLFFFSSASNVTISNNVIGANGMGNTKSHGIAIANGTTTNVSITNNYIGVSPSGASIGNGNSGMDLQGVNTATITGNYIGANQGRRSDIPAAGIALSNGTTLVSITGNYIGLAPGNTAAGQQLNGSYDGSAIRAEGTATKIMIDNNDLAYSAGNGVNVIGGADFVQIFNNRIYCNTAKGINLNCGGSAPNGPGNASFGCGTITLNTFTPVPTVVNGGRPGNSVVYLYGTNTCATGVCTTNPQGQFLFTTGTMTYPTGSTWNYNNGAPMYNDITALAVGISGNCSGSYCRTSEFSNCVDNTLPVSLISFNASAVGGNVRLVWQTASELNNDYFLVERSYDGSTFEPIGKVEGKGTYALASTYEFTDLNPGSGTIYYRLRQVDFNSDSSYSIIRDVTIGLDNIITVAPNPNSGSFTITASSKGHYTIEIMNILGQNLYQWEIYTESSLEKKIDTSLSPGTYLIQVKTANAQLINKMVVE